MTFISYPDAPKRGLHLYIWCHRNTKEDSCFEKGKPPRLILYIWTYCWVNVTTANEHWDAVAILQKRSRFIKNSTRPLRHFIDMFAQFPWWNSEMRKHNSFAVWPPNPTGDSKHGNRFSLPRDEILPHLSRMLAPPIRQNSKQLASQGLGRGRKKNVWMWRTVVLGESTGNQYGLAMGQMKSQFKPHS